ncbi:MAG TPA: retroviral-like aspartic protease family protein [Vicinamibacterales bacterium]|nr:retroviral-like aspartic protease family protein [Vicinamibacterales bacterium]
MMRWTLRFVLCAAAVVAGTLVLQADDKITAGDAELQFQLGNLLSDETRFREALDAYDKATKTDDHDLQVRARAGKVKTALRIAEYELAQKEGELLRAAAPSDSEALALYADSLWSVGLFDEADEVYEQALDINKESSRARFGLARSLATRTKLDEALKEAQAAAAMAPRDGEIHAEIGAIFQRLHRFDEAANAYDNFINLLPNKDRSDKAAWTRSQVKFLKAFEGRNPVEIDPEDLETTHTMPFRLVDDKIVIQAKVNGGRNQDFILDTGSEETVISRDTAQRANITPITYTLSAGVGEVGLRGLQLSRINRLDIGDLQVRNLPVLVKNPALRGIPKREGESFSPLSFGMSMLIDYQHRTLTMGRTLPEGDAGDLRLPMRVHRLAMVRGMLNSTRPTYFVVDTGGEVISISAATAGYFNQNTYRRIPLKVYGTSGWDRDAFLLPGMDLNFDQIEYKNMPLVVLNLRAPSVLLGFQLGGIVGHNFLSHYKVALDMERSELRLQKF